MVALTAEIVGMQIECYQAGAHEYYSRSGLCRYKALSVATTIEIREAIANANKDFMVILSQGNAAGMADLYTVDGQVLPPNSDFVIGKKAIQMFWQAIMDMRVKEAKLEIVELEEQEDLGVEMPKYTLQGDEGQVLDQGKYIVIWKREDGQWKLHRHIFNSSLPVT